MKTVLGLDRIEEYGEWFEGRKIGLITNYSGINSAWENNIDLFEKAGYDLAKLYTPEHGLYGAADGAAIENGVYPGYNIPIISLYGDKKKPSKEDLEGVDILVYDIQDVGLRYYTFIYTMAYCMQAAAEKNIPFVVLDRPNPLGAKIISGACIIPELASFVGAYELPVRYGLTCGELGAYFKKYDKLDLDYRLIEMKNYTRDMTYPDTGLIWNIPSPALPGFKNTLCYCGGCFTEATNISEGRGTPKPFQMYGTPYTDMDALYDCLKKEITEENIAFRKRTFVPFVGKYKGEVCFGVEYEPLSNTIDFIPIALKTLKAIKDLNPEKFAYRIQEEENHLDALIGDHSGYDYLEGKRTLEEVLLNWKAQSALFEEKATEYYLY